MSPISFNYNCRHNWPHLPRILFMK